MSIVNINPFSMLKHSQVENISHVAYDFKIIKKKVVK